MVAASLLFDTRHWPIARPYVRGSSCAVPIPYKIMDKVGNAEDLEFLVELKDTKTIVLHAKPRPKPWVITPEDES